MTTKDELEAKGSTKRPPLDYSELSQALKQGNLLFLGPEKKVHAIPEPLLKIIQEATYGLSLGKNVQVVTSDLLITTQDAADYLGMSRPTFVQLLVEGKLPYTQAGDGRHRRIRISDLVEYQNRVSADRRKNLANMVQIGQEMMADPDFVEPSMEEIIRTIKEIRRENGGKRRTKGNS